MLKYTGPGVYRFLDEAKEVIYIGSSKNIQKRLTSHFYGKQGHLGSKVYTQVASVQVCKCEDYPAALALEMAMISKYRPKYNKIGKSHNINYQATKDIKYYENKEIWRTYYKFKEYNTDKIEANKKDDIKALVVAAALFVGVILLLVT